MKVKFDKVYEHKHVEQRWYDRWLEAGAFRAQDKSDKPPFCIVIPPPNVTGSLHMGHALNETLQDIQVRYKRMSGFNTLWMPGMDHAGIATQNVVDRHLAAQNIHREEMGREAFVDEVWKWKEEYGGKIMHQIKRLGSSCDWDRARFTMDEGLSHAVRHVFVELYNQGYIYRGEYIVNWCPKDKTALSDLEVEHEEVDGKLYSIKYPIADDGEKDQFIEVATTRPETMLGDTAVAVHPDDDRYKHLVGKSVRLPLVERMIPIIADAEVKQEFGSGAVKITPGHDFNDFEMGKRHGLEILTILDESARIELPDSPYHGLDVKEARKRVIGDLKKAGLYISEKPHKHMVGHSQRSGAVIEPRVSYQWFMKMQELADNALDAVRSGKTEFLPKTWEKTYFDWLENIRDWCISRQLWWGHRIPVWYCDSCNATTVTTSNPKKCSSCDSDAIRQDEDVLDTWFSSALWPFSTLGWPAETEALKTFYPTSLLVTGFDIIFFWVARMMMMGLKFMNEVPFKLVCIHALVRDAKGQKMSKSKGNVIDPLDLMDNFGTDSLRFTLTALAVHGRDVLLSDERIQGYRRFINKLWNASRFVALGVENLKEKLGSEIPPTPDAKHMSVADRWIRGRLHEVTKQAKSLYDDLQFSDSANQLYHFVWHEYCDWYIEMAKTHLMLKDEDLNDTDKTSAALATASNLLETLDTILRLLHPIIPFVTEEIWQKVVRLRDHTGSDFLMLADFPEAKQYGAYPSEEMNLIQKIITTIRTMKSENSVSPGKRVPIMFEGANEQQQKSIIANWAYLRELGKLERLHAPNQLDELQTKTAGPVASSVADGIKVKLPLGELIDVPKEKARLQKDIAKVKKDLERTEKKLANPSFLKNAPDDVVAEQKSRLAASQNKIDSLQAFLKRLSDF